MAHEPDVLVIGAGACGLTAARFLLQQGRSVYVLEAQEVHGGRIATRLFPGFSAPVESGAEFIHGDCPITFAMLKEYGMTAVPMKGFYWQTRSNKNTGPGGFLEDHHRLLVKRLEEIRTDMSVNRFLELYFPEVEYAMLRDDVRGFVEGYDAADPEHASVIAFRNEWTKEEDTQYRIEGGYGKLMEHLFDACNAGSGKVLCNHPVKTLRWERNRIVAETPSGNFGASRVIVTVPAGVLCSDRDTEGHIRFVPDLPEKTAAARMLGFGNVIKVLMEFREPFWKSALAAENAGRSLEKLGFIFSDAPVPTWWTQYPADTALLTGWLGGPRADKGGQHSSDLQDRSLESLAAIFGVPVMFLRARLNACRICDWSMNPYSRGAYSYSVVEGQSFKKILRTPGEDTIYFAGEALHSGDEAGTVEAALAESFRAAREIMEKSW